MEALDRLKQVVPADGPDNVIVRVQPEDVVAVAGMIPLPHDETVATLRRGAASAIPPGRAAPPVYQTAGPLRHLLTLAGG